MSPRGTAVDDLHDDSANAAVRIKEGDLVE